MQSPLAACFETTRGAGAGGPSLLACQVSDYTHRHQARERSCLRRRIIYQVILIINSLHIISLAVIFNYHKNYTYAVLEINYNYNMSYMFRRIAAEATYCCKLGIKLPGSAGKKVVFLTNRASCSGIFATNQLSNSLDLQVNK